jgi:hypothetical protein
VTEDVISIREAARLSGVPTSTLRRWARRSVVPVRDGRWTVAAAAPTTFEFEPIGRVDLPGFPRPVELFTASVRAPVG